MRQITVPDETYDRLLEQAQHRGFPTIADYLADLAEEPEDDFVLTPEIQAAIQEGIDDVRAGRTVGWDEAKDELERFKREWREGRS